MDNKEILKIAQEEFTKLQELIGFIGNVDVDLIEEEDGTVIKIEVIGDELGYMIGNRGRHLNGLQFIFGMMLRRKVGDEKRLMVNLDIGGYREERIEKVKSIALSKADEARIQGADLDMRPMNPADRRIVHITLKQFDDVSTESHGEGKDRFIRIVPSTEADLGILDDDIEGLGGEGEEQSE